MAQIDDALLFARVAEQRSFTAVADELDTSRSLVSKRIRLLEDRLGLRLLNRTTRSLSLTESGKLYYRYCATIRDTLEEAERRLGEMGEQPRGRLKISVPVTFGEMYVAPLLGEFLERYADLQVDMYLDERFVDLVEEGYDLAIRIGVLADSSMVARRLGSSRLVVCAAPAYLTRHGTPEHPDDLRRHNCLTYRYESHRSSEWRFRIAGHRRVVPVAGNLRCDNGIALREAVRAGLGLGYLPTFIVAGDLFSDRLHRVLADYGGEEIGIYAVYPHQQNLPGKVQAFVNFLAEQFAYLRDWLPSE